MIDQWVKDRTNGRIEGIAPDPIDPEYVMFLINAIYFNGDWRAFDDLELEPGGTEFQREVWRELRRIPPGQAISYADLAQSIRRPAAVRAVGRANALNPIAIIVPCHRVIGKDGTLTGYAGGLKRKEWLLRHEGALLV